MKHFEHPIQTHNILLCLLVIAASLPVRLACAQGKEQNARRSTRPVTVQGIVTDTGKHPLIGATVRIAGSRLAATTDSLGRFQLNLPDNGRPLFDNTLSNPGNNTTTGNNSSGQTKEPGTQKHLTLLISYVGYKTQEISLTNQDGRLTAIGPLNIRLVPDNQLSEVTVSSGYQQLPLRNTTGSYGVVGKELLDRSVSTDILPKLEGVTPSLAFDHRAPDQLNLSVRGRSTILSDNTPLIVLDHFPFNGDLHDINPNDIESVTVLRDAASAAIWGARAGNGVIVVTTKHGRYNDATHISLNTSWTLGEKPDLFYSPNFLSSADFISVEEQLFNQGYYTANVQSPDKPLLSPVVDLLAQVQAGTLSQGDADARINSWKGLDVRKDFSQYFYRQSLNQQYSLSVDGGGASYNYLVSGGFDQNRANLGGNSDNRYTLHAVNNFKVWKSLTIGSDISYASTHAVLNNPGYTGINSGNGTATIYPYAQLADAGGNPLPVAKDHPLSFSENAESQGFLDWTYKPLEELRIADNTSNTKDTRLKFNVRYNILPGLTAETLYQYEHSAQDGRSNDSQDTYFARDLINQYAQPGGVYPVPLGGILNIANSTLDDQDGRFQLNYAHLFSDVHQLNIVAGAELRNSRSQSSSYRLYGYDNNILVNQPVDYADYFPLNPGGDNSGSIPYIAGQTDQTDRYVSEYLTANYNYAERWYFSASARKDASNLFGVNANDKGVPLYSVGAGWEASREPNWKLGWLSYLKLRATYGYTGNVNKSVTAFTTALYGTDFYTHLPDALIYTPPNPDLQWERVRTVNLGLDFATKDKRLSGSIDWYWKKGSDQLGSVALDPTTGFFVDTRYSYELNSSGFTGKGADLELNSLNLRGVYGWQTRLLLSYSTNKVTQYQYQNPVSDYFAPDAPPLLGKPLQGIYSYKWAGLDPQNGNPRVYVNGVPSEDYGSIAANATVKDLVYKGPALPPVFGSLLNTWTYKQLSLSANISYKFGYYFHRPSIAYANLVTSWEGNSDFDKRWRKPGDEQFTQVPSLDLSGDATRDNAYINSSQLVTKGDNIRLQDLQLAYTLDARQLKRLPFRSLSVYGYATNLGILWRANHYGLDPDYLYGNAVIKPPRTWSLGIRANF